jgi:hypothetical protein
MSLVKGSVIPLTPRQLQKFIDRCLEGANYNVRNAAQIHIEYWDDDLQTHRRVPAYFLSMEQTEHGPKTIVVSERKLV